MSGSVYYNCKGHFSFILLAILDADYKFIQCNTGAAGSDSDAGVFNGSRLHTSHEEERIAVPDPEPLPGDDSDMPYLLVGDDALVDDDEAIECQISLALKKECSTTYVTCPKSGGKRIWYSCKLLEMKARCLYQFYVGARCT
jgi:hypothetical protein